MICGVIAGGMASILLFALFSGRPPYPGILGILVWALPGLPVGALLGWSYPRPFTMIGDGIFSGL
jgi:hypothetical protein